VSINERLASLEATVKNGFETARRDREEARWQAANDLQAMKDMYAASSLRLDVQGDRLDAHDKLISQGKGFQKALTWVWGGMLTIWGIIEGLAHFGKGK
jgi:hypothetical protein